MARLAVIAGKGDLPVTLAESASSKGEDVVILAVAGQADADFSSFEVHEVALGAIGKTRDLMRGLAVTGGHGWQDHASDTGEAEA